MSEKISALVGKAVPDGTDLFVLAEPGVDNFKITWTQLVAAIGSAGTVWGGITGTLADQLDLQAALDLKVDENAPVVGATKTKITFDAKGLVTAGADATTADITEAANLNYVSDAELIVIGNTSGVNTGDQTLGGLGGVPTTRAITVTAPLSGGGDLSADRNISTSMNTNKLIGRGTAGVGIFEEITLGTNLSLAGTTLNATGSGGVAWGAITGTLSDQTDLQTALDAKADESITINTAAPLSGGGDLSANRTLTTSMATNKLIGRGTAGSGVFEEITLGTNLSLTGTTLNATGGSGSGLTQPQVMAISSFGM